MAIVEPMAFAAEVPERRQTLPSRATISGNVRAMGRSALRDWLSESTVQIKELLLLDSGWDGSVGAAISGSAVEAAIAWVTSLAGEVDGLHRPYVSPTSNGGVNLEWHGPDAHFDVTFEDDKIWVFASSATLDWEGAVRDIPLDAVALLIFRFSTR